MASFLIHMCICDEVNKVIKKDRNKILIGSIAPDIAKLIGIDRNITHFGEYPNFNEKEFLLKYKNNLNDDFVLGYYIHLYTDYLWDKFVISKIYKDGVLTMIDGNKIKYDKDICYFLYEDYDTLIDDIINEYHIDLKFLKEELPQISNIIKEVPIDKLNIVVDKTYEVINKKNKSKLNVLNMDLLNEFINYSVNKMIYKIDKIA